MWFLCWNPRPWWTVINKHFFPSAVFELFSTLFLSFLKCKEGKMPFQQMAPDICIKCNRCTKALLIRSIFSVHLNLGCMCMCLFIPHRGQESHQDVNCLLLDSYRDAHALNTGHYHSWAQKPVVSDAGKKTKKICLFHQKDESFHVVNVCSVYCQTNSESITKL